MALFHYNQLTIKMKEVALIIHRSLLAESKILIFVASRWGWECQSGCISGALLFFLPSDWSTIKRKWKEVGVKVKVLLKLTHKGKEHSWANIK